MGTKQKDKDKNSWQTIGLPISREDLLKLKGRAVSEDRSMGRLVIEALNTRFGLDLKPLEETAER